MARRVLVGLDRSADAEAVLRAAVEVARRDHAQLLIVLVSRASPLTGRAAMGSCCAAMALRAAEHDRMAELHAAVHALPADISVRFEVRPAPLAGALASAARELCCDTVIAAPRLRRRLLARCREAEVVALAA